MGITVAKISEAEVMADGGILDIFVAYPLVTEETIRQAIALREREGFRWQPVRKITSWRSGWRLTLA